MGYDRQQEDDIVLWASFCQGDQQAFLLLYESYFTLLYSWGCRWLNANSQQQVEDTIHDFFIYLWEKKAGLSRDIVVRSYLLTTFKRRLLYQDMLQKRLTVQEHPDDELPVSLAEQQAADFFAEQFEKVKKAMDLLTPAQREVIELRYFENKSIPEIAAAKNTSVRTVYNLMHRALATLKSEALKKSFALLW